MKKLKMDINFFNFISRKKDKKSASFESGIKKSIIIFIIFVILFAVPITVMNYFTKLRTTELIIQNSQLISDAELKKIEADKNQAAKLKTENDMFKQKMDDFTKSNKIVVNDISDIAKLQPDTVTIAAFSYAEGQVSLSCIGSTELAAPDFAELVRNSGIFDDVDYSGSTKNPDGSYNFQLSFRLKEEIKDGQPEQ